jgi:ribose transport system ATP-binding protein
MTSSEPAVLDVPAGARGPVELVGITKVYGGNTVLHDVSVAFAPGTVHGLVGENGAGKSTLMKVLTGVERPTSGQVMVDGSEQKLRAPSDAIGVGLSIISQELALVPARSVAENVFLGAWSSTGGVLRSRQDRSRCAELTKSVGFALPPDRLVRTLTVAQQQQVEVLRAVARSSRLIVMDEPTAVLTDTETRALLDLIRRLADNGASIVWVSHFLEEVLSVCDTVTVLRDGRHILTEPAADHTPDSLVKAMAGRSIDILFPARPTTIPSGDVLLEARGLSRRPHVFDVDLDLRVGEIVGVAGLVGSGRSELARLIFGADSPDRGEMRLDGQPFTPSSPGGAMRRGVAMVPESRKDQGLLLNQSIRENVTIASLGSTSHNGVRSRRAEGRLARTATESLDVRGASLDGPVWTLSGGNQQKVLFAKWIARKPRLLIIDEPTRGVDVGAKVQIHQLIRELASAGTTIVLISSEIEEVLGLADRVYVMRQGRVSGEFDARTASTEQVLAAAFADKGNTS